VSIGTAQHPGRHMSLHIFYSLLWVCCEFWSSAVLVWGAEILIDFVSFPLYLQEELLSMSRVIHISLWIFLYVQLSSCLVITCMPLFVVQDLFCNEIVIYTDLANPMNNPVSQEQVCLLE
jgi:hypothetical protein